MRDTLAIVGSHPQTRMLFDFNREDCDVIVFNEAMKEPWCGRADYVLQMHIPTIWRNPKNRNDPHHYEWLQREDIPLIIMQDEYPDVPRSVKYPMDEICDGLLGKFNFRYFTSSVAYALAWAIWKGYRKIELYGVEMETTTEYAAQRPGVAFWVGYALGYGIEFESHVKMFDEPLYGYEGDIRLDYAMFDKRLNEVAQPLQDITNQYNAQKKSAEQYAAEFVATGLHPENVHNAIMTAVQLATQFGILDGIRQEVVRYKGKADEMIKASGGDFVFSRQEFEGVLQALAKAHGEAILQAQAAGAQCHEQFEYAKKAKARERRHNRMKAFTAAVEEYIKAATKVGIYEGAGQENQRLIKELDALIRAAGGEKSAEVLMEDFAQKVAEPA